MRNVRLSAMSSQCTARPLVTLFLLLTLAQTGCSKPSQNSQPQSYTLITLQDGRLQRSSSAAPQAPALAQWKDQIALLSASLEPQELSPGQTLRLRFAALKPLDRDWTIFIHGQLKQAELNQWQDDHAPLNGQYPTSQWLAGDIIEEQRSLNLPKDLQGAELDLYLGFYQGKERLQVSQAAHHDGHNRVLVATVKIPGGVDKREAMAQWSDGPLKIDGLLDEPVWKKAEKLGPFVNYNGRGIASHQTRVRVAYDDKALYLGFDCQDPDAWTSYSKRDDPLYNEEAVEIFIDADGDLKDYVELQTAPNNLHFDAAFTGRRKNMDTAYNAEYQTAVKVDGTLNDPSDQDRGWVAEWRIPFDQIRGLKSAPKAGDRWRVNFFRLDRVRRGKRVVQNQASAWSSPRSGDFHNIQRFGWLRFGPQQTDRVVPAPAAAQ